MPLRRQQADPTKPTFGCFGTTATTRPRNIQTSIAKTRAQPTPEGYYFRQTKQESLRFADDKLLFKG